MSPFSHLLAPAHLGSHEFQKAYKTEQQKKSELKQNKSKQNKKLQLHIGRIVVCFSRVTKWQQF